MIPGRAISVVKLAAMSRAAVEAAESLGAVPGALIRAGKGTLHFAGELGAGIAHGAGVDRKTGEILGKGALIGGGIYAAKRSKDRVDNWKYQHGFYGG